MKHIKTFVVSACLGLGTLAAANAAPVLIDFEDSAGEGGPGTTMLKSQGMVFDWSVLSPSIPVVSTNNFAGQGGRELLFCGWCEDQNGTSLYAANGAVFDLTSFAFGSNGGGSMMPYNGTVTGFLDGGGTVSKNFTVALGAFATVTFDAAWSDLTSVDIVVQTIADGHEPFEAFALDDVAVDVVPIPAAVWMLLSALGSLAAFRRK